MIALAGMYTPAQEASKDVANDKNAKVNDKRQVNQSHLLNNKLINDNLKLNKLGNLNSDQATKPGDIRNIVIDNV